MKQFKLNEGRFNIDSQISIVYNEYGKSELEHRHEGIELMYIVSGHGENIVNGKPITSMAGSLLIMNQTCTHEIKMWESMQYYNVMFNPAFVNDSLNISTSLKELFSKTLNTEVEDDFVAVNIQNKYERTRVENILIELLGEIVEKGKNYKLLAHNYLEQLLIMIARKSTTTPHNVIEDDMERAVKYICNHCDEPLYLEDVADMFHYNSDYFSKKLKAYYGVSFKQILIHQKMSNVIYDLLNTDDSIDSIISKNGFSNKTHFYDIFMKTHGVRPKFIREYRNNFYNFIELKVKYRSGPDKCTMLTGLAK